MVNKVILIGRLGKDPEVRSTPGGQTVTKFTLATDERFTDRSGEKQERTEWHNIVAWGKLGEICGQVDAVTYAPSTISVAVSVPSDGCNSGGGLSAGAIAGIVVGAVVGGVLVALLIVFLTLYALRRRDVSANQSIKARELSQLNRGL